MKHQFWFIHIPKNAGSTISEIFLKKLNYLLGVYYYRRILKHKYESKDILYKNFLKEKYDFLGKENKLLNENYQGNVIYDNPNRINFWHIPMNFWHDKLIKEYQKIYVIFCVIRNPYERVISLFKYWISYHKNLTSNFNEKSNLNKIISKKINYIFNENYDIDEKNLNKFVNKVFSSKKYEYYMDGHLLPQYLYVYDNKGKQIPSDIIRYENLQGDLFDFFDKYNIQIDPNILDSVHIFKTVDSLNITSFNEESIQLINKYYDLDFKYLNYKKIGTNTINNLNSQPNSIVKLNKNINNAENNVNKKNKFQNKNYSIFFQPISYEINIVNPMVELKRFDIVSKIKENIGIIFQKHKLNIDVNKILPRFIMNQFVKKSYFVDSLLPYNASEFTQLHEDLYFLSNKKLNSKKIESLIKELDLKNKFNEAIKELKQFINDHIKIKNKSVDYRVEENEDNVHYYFKLIIEDQSYLKFIHKFNFSQLKINKKLYEKMKNNYILGSGKFSFFKILIQCLIIRYHTLESYNQQLAINPHFKEYLHKKYSVDFELFASSINCYYQNYCSLFYDIEKYFQSKGFFDNISIEKGFYVANPPFDNKIMENMSKQFVKALKQSKEPISILITIPEWDKKEYGGFKSLELLKESKFITFQKIIPKKKARFFDYYEDKVVYPVSIYLIILQNEAGKKKHPIDNEFQNNIEKYFNSSSSIKVGDNHSKKKNIENSISSNNKDEIVNMYQIPPKNSYLSFEVNFPKEYSWKKDLIILKNPLDYRSLFERNYYSNISLINKKFLLSYNNDVTKKPNVALIKGFNNKPNKQIILKKSMKNFTRTYIQNILNLYFGEEILFENMGIIDLRFECKNFQFIYSSSYEYYSIISDYFIQKKIFYPMNIELIYNPLYKEITKQSNARIHYITYLEELINYYKEKKSFVIIHGTLEYFELKAISYYTEQMYSILFFSQIIYMLHILAKGGSFINYTYTFCTKINQDILKLLNKYFDHVILHKEKNFKGNYMYLIGKNFHEIPKKELTLLKKIYQEIFQFYKNLDVYGENLNVFDPTLRKEKNIVKFIRNFQTNNFIHNLVQFDTPKNNKILNDFNKKLDKFHKDFFKLNI